MSITHDANTRFPATNGTTGVDSSDTTTGDRTFSHAGTASARAAIVVLGCTGNTTTVSGVLYGGIAMTLSATANDTTEAGRVEIYTLTGRSQFPLGTQTVTLQGCTATAKWATCSTVATTLPWTTVNGTNTVDTTVAANPTATISTTRPTLSYGGCHNGANAPATAVGTGCTLQHSQDYGTLSANSLRRTSEDAAGSIAVQATLASDDHCIAAVAIAENEDQTNAFGAGAPGNGPMY